ncbi:MAG: hypothetical protein ACYC1C_10940 [Chloroflexota bacterium]
MRVSRRSAARIPLVVVLVVALMSLCGEAGAPVANAQSVTWQSPFVVQNVDTVDATEVQVQFIDLNTGDPVKVLSLGSLAAGKSVAVRPYSIPDLGPGKYSVVVSADAKVTAIVNQVGGTLAGSYVGAMGGALVGTTTINFPNIVRNYSGWNSPFYIQNASDSDTTATVKFYRFSDGAEVASLDKTLKGGQTYEVDPATVSGLSDNTQYAVVATAGQPLAGMANQISSSAVMSYSAFSSGGTKVSLPNITRNYFDWNTPFIVQNVGSAPTQVTAKYYRFSDGALVKSDGPYSLDPGKSRPFRPYSTSGLADDTQYSVVVESTAPSGGSAQPVVALVNEVAGAQAMSYGGFAGGGTTISMPNIVRNYSDWNSPFVVQNVGTTATQITAKYYRFSDGALALTDGPYTLDPGMSRPFRPHATAGLVDNTQYSVVVESQSEQIVSVVNEVHPSIDAMAYEGAVAD